MTKGVSGAIIFAAVGLVAGLTGVAGAHWDMESRFWQDKKQGEVFHFRLHNGSHANRQPVVRELDVCFWLEEKIQKGFAAVSEKKCQLVTMKPDEWRDFRFVIDELKVNQQARKSGSIVSGVYKARVSAQEQKHWISAMLFGAALERLALDLELKKGKWKLRKKSIW